MARPPFRTDAPRQVTFLLIRTERIYPASAILADRNFKHRPTGRGILEGKESPEVTLARGSPNRAILPPEDIC